MRPRSSSSLPPSKTTSTLAAPPWWRAILRSRPSSRTRSRLAESRRHEGGARTSRPRCAARLARGRRHRHYARLLSRCHRHHAAWAWARPQSSGTYCARRVVGRPSARSATLGRPHLSQRLSRAAPWAFAPTSGRRDQEPPALADDRRAARAARAAARASAQSSARREPAARTRHAGWHTGSELHRCDRREPHTRTSPQRASARASRFAALRAGADLRRCYGLSRHHRACLALAALAHAVRLEPCRDRPRPYRRRRRPPHCSAVIGVALHTVMAGLVPAIHG